MPQPENKPHPHRHNNQNCFHIDTIELHASDVEHSTPIFPVFIDDTNHSDTSTIFDTIEQHNKYKGYESNAPYSHKSNITELHTLQDKNISQQATASQHPVYTLQDNQCQPSQQTVTSKDQKTKKWSTQDCHSTDNNSSRHKQPAKKVNTTRQSHIPAMKTSADNKYSSNTKANNAKCSKKTLLQTNQTTAHCQTRKH